MPIAHKILLKPTLTQIEYFVQAAGTRRFTWNWALGQITSQIRQKKDGLREKIDSCEALKIKFNAIKYKEYPWIEGVHRDAHSQPFSDLAEALTQFHEGIKGFPQFKAKNHTERKFYVANDKFSVGIHKGKPAVKLPFVGWVALAEKPRFKGKILSGNISEYDGQWFLAITFHELEEDLFKDIPEHQLEQREAAKSIDANTLSYDVAVSSKADQFESYKIPDKIKDKNSLLPKRLRHLQRKLAHKVEVHAKPRYTHAKKMWEGSLVPFSLRDFYSKNMQKLIEEIRHVHAQIKAIRHDFLHKTTTHLVQTAEVICIEDLNVKGMTKSAKGTVEKPGKKVKQTSGLNRAILNAAFGEFKRQLEYKSQYYGTVVIKIDRWFPSSKKCSAEGCGYINKQLKLKDREWTCPHCGAHHHRDENAAKNILNEGLRVLAELGGASAELMRYLRERLDGATQAARIKMAKKISSMKSKGETFPKNSSTYLEATDWSCQLHTKFSTLADCFTSSLR